MDPNNIELSSRSTKRSTIALISDNRRQLPPTPPVDPSQIPQPVSKAICTDVVDGVGISYAELRYDVPSNISTVGSEPSASVNSFECNNLSNDHKEAESANHKGGTLFSVTGNSKPPLRRTPTDYDLPPLPAPRKQPGEKKLSDPTHDDNKDIQLPVRNRLRETNDNNKENSIDEVQVDHLVAKGYDRLRVVDALRVARNNMTMAEEILETFGSSRPRRVIKPKFRAFRDIKAHHSCPFVEKNLRRFLVHCSALAHGDNGTI
uniref:Uncharacterized protein n=1 Tax=Magallana gigas TaxID=29159 RepID=K1Q6D5_MAGGI